MSFGYTFDKAKGAALHNMANPWAPQRREPLARAFENIPDRMDHRFPRRIANGDLRPIRGFVQTMPDGSPGGRPIAPPATLMAPLAMTPMVPQGVGMSNRMRNRMERTVQAKRFVQKEHYSLLQLNKPSALDAAKSLRGKPGTADKPAPPVDFIGGFTRVFERNRAFPKDTGVSMKPIETLGTRWGAISLPTFSAPSSAVGARFPKTL